MNSTKHLVPPANSSLNSAFAIVENTKLNAAITWIEMFMFYPLGGAVVRLGYAVIHSLTLRSADQVPRPRKLKSTTILAAALGSAGPSG